VIFQLDAKDSRKLRTIKSSINGDLAVTQP